MKEVKYNIVVHQPTSKNENVKKYKIFEAYMVTLVWNIKGKRAYMWTILNFTNNTHKQI